MRIEPHSRFKRRADRRGAARWCAGAQRGQVLLLLIVMVSVATALLVYGSTTAVARAVKADSRTRAALEEARQVLIGRAVADANRPGSLPCPDNDGDGSSDFFTGTACPSYIGRLPWRTLGINDLRDDAGERLWYILAPPFRDHPLAPPLNTDTRGTLTLYSQSSARVVTHDAIALVIAPGGAHAGQRRDTAVAHCATSGKYLPRDRCPTNYLDTAGEVSNASATGPYLAAAASELFNDKVVAILAADLMPLVERRVALEARNALLAYRSTSPCRCYPWPDAASDGASDVGTNRGRLPTGAALPHPWPPGTLPAYFAANQWGRVLHFSVAQSALDGAGKVCRTCRDASLSIDGASGYDVVLIATGYAQSKRSAWNDYIDDEENRDDDDRFVTPRSQQPGRDRVFAITGAASGCAAAARVLLDNVPCAAPETGLRSVCGSTQASLAQCPCAAAARTVTHSRCAAALADQQCELAISDLRRCS